MNFWIIAIALFVVSAAVMCWPLFTGSTKDRIHGILLMLIIPVTGLLLYQGIGTPEALRLSSATARQAAQPQSPHPSGEQDIETMVAQLQQRMAENPEDIDGWLILGRTLKTMQRYAEAEAALANANQLVPGTPIIMIELAEAKLFASGSQAIPEQARQLIESALAIDPQQPKGLWLLGMVAVQQGDDARAIETWQKLLAQLDPTSGPAQTVSEQINLARTRMGQVGEEVAGTTTEVTEIDGAEAPEVVSASVVSGIPVTIGIANEFANSVPANATLFVFIHPAGAAGMPLAVKRMAARGFPISLNLSDADLLRPGTSLLDFEQLDISARISISGIANAAPGDYQANKVTLDTKAVKAIALNLDQRLP